MKLRGDVKVSSKSLGVESGLNTNVGNLTFPGDKWPHDLKCIEEMKSVSSTSQCTIYLCLYFQSSGIYFASSEADSPLPPPSTASDEPKPISASPVVPSINIQSHATVTPPGGKTTRLVLPSPGGRSKHKKETVANSSSSVSSKGVLPSAASGGSSLLSSVCGLLVPPGGGGDVWEEEGIPVLERLIRTHPVWYLPGVGRAEATHLLHRHEPGVSTLFCRVKVRVKLWGWGRRRESQVDPYTLSVVPAEVIHKSTSLTRIFRVAIIFFSKTRAYNNLNS